MNFVDSLDGITVEALRASGATKWSSPDGALGAFIAEMDFGAAPEITAALHAAVDEGSFGYLPVGHTRQLRAAASGMLAREYGWHVDDADIWPVPDVIKALEMAVQHHSLPGSKVIVPTPAYMPFLLIPPRLGRQVIETPMLEEGGCYRLDLQAIDKAFDDGGNLLVLCNPHNPTGRVFAEEELRALSEVVHARGGRVFADEIWAPLVYSGQRHVPYASISKVAAGHAVTAISASKAWNLPGLKCAQVVVSNDPDRVLWEKMGFYVGHAASNLGIVATVAAYRAGFDWLGQIRAYLDRNRRALATLLQEHLPTVRYHLPEGTYIAWLDFRGTRVADDPALFFRQHAGVSLTDGGSCGRDFQGFSRLIFATPLPVLTLLVERMGAAMRS